MSTAELELVARRATQIQPLDVRETRAAMAAYQSGLEQIVDDSTAKSSAIATANRGGFSNGRAGAKSRHGSGSTYRS